MSFPSHRTPRSLLALIALSALPVAGVAWLRSLEAMPDIAAPSAPDLPAPNGYDLYVRAAQAVPRFDPPVDACQHGMNCAKTAAEGAVFYSLERREAWNDEAAPAWELFAQAQNAQTRDPITPNFVGDPFYGYLRVLAHDKRAQSNLHRMRGDIEGAVRAALDGMEMGVAIGRGGAILGRAVSAAIVSDSIRAINDTDRLPDKLPASIARAAARRLEEIIARLVPWTEAIEREREFQLVEVQRAFDGDDWRARHSKDQGSRPQDWRARLKQRLTSRRAAVATIEDSAVAAIAGHRAPYWSQNDGGYAPNYQRTLFLATRERTQLDLLLLRFALCAYRQEHGVYPQFLGALNGDLLQHIPRDCFSMGQPYNYGVAGEDYCLWSVGPNG